MVMGVGAGQTRLLTQRLFAALRAVDVKLIAEFDDPAYDDPAGGQPPRATARREPE